MANAREKGFSRLRTPTEARKDGLVALTLPDHAGAEVETVAGRLRWLDWCQAEALRVAAKGRRAEVTKDVDGRYAVWVSPSPSPNLKPE